MSGPAMFAGGERQRRELLARLQPSVPGTEIYFGRLAEGAPFAELAERYGLHEALLRLIRELGGDGRNTDVSDFYFGMLEALTTGGSALDVVRGWLLWAWEAEPAGLAAALAGSPVLAPATSIADLVRASRTAPVDTAQWAEARAALDTAADEPGRWVDAIQAVRAMASDLEAEPMAPAAVAKAWADHLGWEAMSAIGWTREVNAAFMQLSMEMHEKVSALLPQMTAENMDEVYSRYKAMMKEAVAADPIVTARKAEAQNGHNHGGMARMEWLEEAREALIALAANAAPAASA